MLLVQLSDAFDQSTWDFLTFLFAGAPVIAWCICLLARRSSRGKASVCVIYYIFFALTYAAGGMGFACFLIPLGPLIGIGLLLMLQTPNSIAGVNLVHTQPRRGFEVIRETGDKSEGPLSHPTSGENEST
jgi:hypothetical protein